MTTSSMDINSESSDYPVTDQETGAPIILPSEKQRSDQSKSSKSIDTPHVAEPTKVVKLVKNAQGGIQINHDIQRVCTKIYGPISNLTLERLTRINQQYRIASGA